MSVYRKGSCSRRSTKGCTTATKTQIYTYCAKTGNLSTVCDCDLQDSGHMLSLAPLPLKLRVWLGRKTLQRQRVFDCAATDARMAATASRHGNYLQANGAACGMAHLTQAANFAKAPVSAAPSS